MSWYDKHGVLHNGRPSGVPNKNNPNKKTFVAVGSKYNKWTVLKEVPRRDQMGSKTRGEKVFLCKCECGTKRQVLSYNLRKAKTKSCGCDLPKGQKHARWKGYGEISGNYWNQINHGASERKGRSYSLEFTITAKYAWELFLKQNRKCSLSGLPIAIKLTSNSKTRFEHTASLDRIDSRIGYVEGNVQWVHKEINMMKRTMSQERFIELCKTVAKNLSDS